jgi:hypothetical protein
MVFKEQPHCRGDRRIDRCARVVVEVDTLHGQNTMTLPASVIAAASSSIVLRPRCPLYPLVRIAALECRGFEFQA